MKAKIGLALTATLLTLVVLEGVLRIGAAVGNRGLLSAMQEAAPPPAWSRVTLGQMIRRARSPRIVYELRAGLQVVYEGGRVTTNSHGFRGPELQPSKPAGSFRIVGLGDSYMFGQGVSDGETYMAQLTESLRASSRARAWEVINTAVPGYNTVMEVATLQEKGLHWQPDLIVLEVVGNDFDLPNFIRAPEDPTTGRRSFLADFVSRRLGRARRDRAAVGPGASARGEDSRRRALP